MRIAVASEHDKVTHHFGHCDNFNIFDTDDGKIISRKLIDNPGHRPGFLPKLLNDMGVKVVISGGMGQRAVDIFQAQGIKVITGATGSAQENVESYLAGKLVSNDIICHEHEHQADCGGH